MGACLYSFFTYFTPFLAKVGPSSDQFGEVRFVHSSARLTFPPDLKKSGGVGRPTPPDFFLCQIDFFPHFTA
jgi:hypothetical protein